MKKYCCFFLCFLLFSCIYDSFLSRYGEEWMAEQTGRPSSTNSTTTTSLNNSSDNGGSSSSDNTTTTTLADNGNNDSTTTSSTTTTTIFVNLGIKVGDIIYEDGSFGTEYNSNKTPIGIVFVTDGTHGKMVHLKQSESKLEWCKSSANGYELGLVPSTSDGSNSWQLISNGVSDSNIIGNYPIFDYCNELTDGGGEWYVPARDELSDIYIYSSTINSVLQILSNAGIYVMPLNTDYENGGVQPYWSSTTTASSNAVDPTYCVYAYIQEFHNGNKYRASKYEKYYIRAIKKF